MADTPRPVHVDDAEAEFAPREHRQPDNVRVRPRRLRDELRERQLRYVPFSVGEEAREHLMQAEIEPGGIDARSGDTALAEVPDVVVIHGGDGEMDIGHGGSSRGQSACTDCPARQPSFETRRNAGSSPAMTILFNVAFIPGAVGGARRPWHDGKKPP